MIGIIGAMDEEILAFKLKLDNLEEINIHNVIFYKGIINNKEIVVVKCGVGKVSAARTTTLLLTNFNIDLVINIGIAGGNSRFLKPKSIVLADTISYGDANLVNDFINIYEYGQMSGCPRFFKCDEETNNKLMEINKDIIKGLIITSDTFVTDSQFVIDVESHFKGYDILSFDMESASIAQICYFENVKVCILRYISDVCGENNQFENYKDIKSQSSYTLIEIVEKYLS